MEDQGYKQYLIERYSASTVKSYLFAVHRYLEKSGHEGASYLELMDYIGWLRREKESIRLDLHALKSYYRYLVQIGARADNPAQSIRLRDQQRKDVQLQDLFSPEELDRLLERVERYPILKHRNKIIISLLIYQGLQTGEIRRLSIDDVDLEAGTIEIRASRTSNGRSLKLQANQVYWLIQYLEKNRNELLKTDTNQLIISKLGKAENGEGISYLVSTKQHLFPSRKLNPKTIRQSVIANLLKAGKDLRVVQVFAGHKYSSSTERYRQDNVDELKNEVLKYHPLG